MYIRVEGPPFGIEVGAGWVRRWRVCSEPGYSDQCIFLVIRNLIGLKSSILFSTNGNMAVFPYEKFTHFDFPLYYVACEHLLVIWLAVRKRAEILDWYNTQHCQIAFLWWLFYTLKCKARAWAPPFSHWEIWILETALLLFELKRFGNASTITISFLLLSRQPACSIKAFFWFPSIS